MIVVVMAGLVIDGVLAILYGVEYRAVIALGGISFKFRFRPFSRGVPFVLLLSLNLNVISVKGDECAAPFVFDVDVDVDDGDIVTGSFSLVLGVLVVLTLLVIFRLSYMLIGLSSYAVVGSII